MFKVALKYYIENTVISNTEDELRKELFYKEETDCPFHTNVRVNSVIDLKPTVNSCNSRHWRNASGKGHHSITFGGK